MERRQRSGTIPGLQHRPGLPGKIAWLLQTESDARHQGDAQPGVQATEEVGKGIEEREKKLPAALHQLWSPDPPVDGGDCHQLPVQILLVLCSQVQQMFSQNRQVFLQKMTCLVTWSEVMWLSFLVVFLMFFLPLLYAITLLKQHLLLSMDRHCNVDTHTFSFVPSLVTPPQ